MISIIGRLKLEIHEIKSGVGCSDEHNLRMTVRTNDILNVSLTHFHCRVVERNEVGKKIQIPRRVDNGEQNLRLARNACRHSGRLVGT